MAFETVKKARLYRRQQSSGLRGSITKTGGIYLGKAIVAKFPIAQQTAEIYFDVETDQVAIKPKEGGAGRFTFSKQSNGQVIIRCAGFLTQFGILRGQLFMAEIKDINGSRMIVFKVNREKAADDE